MASDQLRIAVVGDTGFDYCTIEDRVALSPSAGRAAEIVRPFAAPTGARFAFEALSAVFEDQADRIKVTGVLPRGGWETPHVGIRDQGVSTIPSSHVVLDRFPQLPSHDAVYRIKKVTPLDIRLPEKSVFRTLQAKEPEGNPQDPMSSVPHLLLIHDGGGTWRQAHNRNTPAFRYVDAAITESHENLIIVDLANTLPAVVQSDREAMISPGLSIWELLSSVPEKVCVICSSRMLRHHGAAIRRHLSWEQTYEDLARELDTYAPLIALARYSHLVIRFGISSVVYIHSPAGARRSASAIFAPLTRDLVHRDRIEDGEVVGANVMLAAAIAAEYSRSAKRADLTQCIMPALKPGLQACIRSYDAGYTIPDGETRIDGFRILRANFSCVRDIIRDGYQPSPRAKPYETIGTAVIPDRLLQKGRSIAETDTEHWSFLREALNDRSVSISRINVGMAITKFGYERIFNSEPGQLEADSDISRMLRRYEYGDGLDYEPVTNRAALDPHSKAGIRWVEPQIAPMYVPILRLGALTIIERAELESLRAIRNLLRRYVTDVPRLTSARQPLSLAVFGPPGAGKSFVVKQIVRSVNDSLHAERLRLIERNVAQFRSIEDLEDALTHASGINNDGRVPVVLFDEFDCAFKGDPLAWLKYFLAPMQDGVFYGARETIHFGPAILIFAGGVNHQFSTFGLATVKDPDGAGQRSKKNARRRLAKGDGRPNSDDNRAREKKVPDFISRLSGHVDILPITRDSEGRKFIIRRAIMLREFLKDRQLMIRRGDHEVAGIDEDILFALLTVDSYKHGVRSMTNILNMCIPIAGQLEKASLPPPAQLNMHLDADEFFKRMFRNRRRPFADTGSAARRTDARNPAVRLKIGKEQGSNLDGSDVNRKLRKSIGSKDPLPPKRKEAGRAST